MNGLFHTRAVNMSIKMLLLALCKCEHPSGGGGGGEGRHRHQICENGTGDGGYCDTRTGRGGRHPPVSFIIYIHSRYMHFLFFIRLVCLKSYLCHISLQCRIQEIIYCHLNVAKYPHFIFCCHIATDLVQQQQTKQIIFVTSQELHHDRVQSQRRGF